MRFNELPKILKINYEDEIQTAVEFSSVNFLRDDEGCSLPNQKKEFVNKLVLENDRLFATQGRPTECAEHRIETGDHGPISNPPYKISPMKRDILKQEIDAMLKDDIIEECESPWASPVVMVKKPNGSFRVCVDYRRLNSVTVSDKYPMPRLDELLHVAKRTKFMSTLDLRAGYWQVPIFERDRDKTSFICPFGLFRFKRMSFGLKNAPATFQRMIDRIKSGIPDVAMWAYLDDVVVISETFEQHLKDLTKVFNRLTQFNLRVNREKCFFFRESIKFLGHIIDVNGIRTNPEKVSAISERPEPRNTKDVKSFLQTCSWYRKFIHNFSEISRPLSNLTKKNIKFTWDESHQMAFNQLKQSLVNAPTLQQADETKPYTLRTDASNYALGAVLLQGEGENERPVEYASRLLLPAERNYNTTEREALAVVWALNKFRGYLDGASVVVGTDHQPLKWLMSLRSPSGRLARWALLIQGFNLQITYTPGKANVVADTLSRPPIGDDEHCNILSLQLDFPTYDFNEIRNSQLLDPEIEKIVKCFEELDHPDLANYTGRGYIMSQGILYRYVPDQDSEEAQLVIPSSQREFILKKYHCDPTAGHYGIEKTIHKIRSRYFWPGMRKTIAKFVSTCTECQHYKVSNLKPSGLLKTPVMQQRFETVAVDLFGPLPTSVNGYKNILIVEDVASRWVELFPVRSATADICARKLIDEIFLRYGIPRRLISDNGPQFISQVLQHTTDFFDVQQCLTPIYHPQANPVERKNRDLKTQLAILVNGNHRNWVEYLPSIRYALNTTRCDSIQQTPAFLTFGRELRTMDDVLHDNRPIGTLTNYESQIVPYLNTIKSKFMDAQEVHEKSQDVRKQQHDRSRRRNRLYKVGDLVLVATHPRSNADKGYTKKFAPRRTGPYQISKVISSHTFEVSTNDSNNSILGRYHVSQIFPYKGQADSSHTVQNSHRDD